MNAGNHYTPDSIANIERSMEELKFIILMNAESLHLRQLVTSRDFPTSKAKYGISSCQPVKL
jgi:hypothetical protein